MIDAKLIEAKLGDLGIVLPAVAAPAANYVPFVRTGAFVFVSGQLPMGPNGLQHAGLVGRDVTVDEAREAAKLCAVNVIAALKAALSGDLTRVKRVVKITGFVQAEAGFTQHPEVVNGASDLFVAVFGEAGRHARAAVGASSLPRNAPVEVEAIFEVA